MSLGVPLVPRAPPPPALTVPCRRGQVVNVTGNQDICYYNFLCAHPLGNLRWVQGGRWAPGGPPHPGQGCGGAPGRERGSAAPMSGLPPRSAFNNILSNLGYVLLGLLFLLIILQREINYNRALVRNDAHALVRDGRPPGRRGGLSRPGPPPPLPPLLLPRSAASPSTSGSSTPWAPLS